MLGRPCVLAAGIVLAAAALTAASPAMAPAATTHRAGTAIPGDGPLISSGMRGDTQTTPNWAGYAVTGSDGEFSSVSAGYTVPALKCPGGSQASGLWVGLDGDTTLTVEQTGIAALCKGTTPKYYSWYEFYPNAPHNFPNTIKPGDAISASVTYSGDGNYVLYIKDSTQHWSHTVHQSGEGDNGSAEAILEAPLNRYGETADLSNFGTASFTSVTVNGMAIGTLDPTEIVMTDSAGKTKAAVSALATNNGFTVTFKRKN
jgi:Peptidase A4 family